MQIHPPPPSSTNLLFALGVGAGEEGTLAQWKAHWRELIEPKITEHHGRIVRITGDGLLLEFASVVVAVRCAVEVQRAMLERNANVPQERRIEFRMGINVGDTKPVSRKRSGEA